MGKRLMITAPDNTHYFWLRKINDIKKEYSITLVQDAQLLEPGWYTYNEDLIGVNICVYLIIFNVSRMLVHGKNKYLHQSFHIFLLNQ